MLELGSAEAIVRNYYGSGLFNQKFDPKLVEDYKFNDKREKLSLKEAFVIDLELALKSSKE